MLPLLASYTPFALVIGSTAADHGAAVAGWAGSVLILGGSAHHAVRTLDQAGPLAAILDRKRPSTLDEPLEGGAKCLYNRLPRTYNTGERSS